MAPQEIATLLPRDQIRKHRTYDFETLVRSHTAGESRYTGQEIIVTCFAFFPLHNGNTHILEHRAEPSDTLGHRSLIGGLPAADGEY